MPDPTDDTPTISRGDLIMALSMLEIPDPENILGVVIDPQYVTVTRFVRGLTAPDNRPTSTATVTTRIEIR